MRALLVVALVGCSCATVAVPRESPAKLKAVADAVDWKATGDEAAQLLSKYLQVNTMNPPGNETAGAEFLAALLEKEGIPSKISEFAPGRGSLIARLPASGTPTDKPICLLSHIDVVPAEPEKWPAATQPLSGVIDANGMIWGRGALDMKGMGAIETMTMLLLKRANVPLKRDVILIAVADEEVANLGMQHVVEHLWSELDCGALVNEGGMGVKNLLFEGQTVFPITVAEKGVLWLRMTAKAEAGHGSTPIDERAPTKLIDASNLVRNRKPTSQIHHTLYELLRRVGVQKGGLTGAILQSPFLVRTFVTNKLMAVPPTRAVITNTCQVTGFEGKGSAPNVVPSTTSAIIDCRLLPGTKPADLLAQLQELVKPIGGVEFEVIQQSEPNESPSDDPFFEALSRHVVEGRTDAVAAPALSPGYTDSMQARRKGTHAYGLVPFEVSGEELGTMHGRDERVSVANVRRGVEVLFRSVLDVAGQE